MSDAKLLPAALAEQAAAARDLARLEALAELELDTRKEGGLERLLEQVARTTTELLPADGGASVILWDPANENFTLSASTVPDQAADHTVRRVRRSGGATRWIVEHRKPLVVRDVEHDPFTANGMLRDASLRSYVGVPITFGGQALGVLYAMSYRCRDYPREDIAFLRLVAGKAAHAIAYARQEAELREALAETSALLRVGTALSAAADLHAALERTVSEVARVFGVRRVLLLAFDRERKKLTYFITGGEAAAALPRLPAEVYLRGLTGHVVAHGQPVISPAGVDDPRESEEVRRIRRADGVGSLMVAPLRVRDEVYGTITVMRDLGEPDFDARNLGILQAIASQASFAISRALLFEEVRRLATVDELTGVSNRRRLLELAEAAFARHRRSGAPLAGLMLDVDRFKPINDNFGHAAGDAVLRTVAQRCQAALREMDLFGRYGGEEFAAVLPDTALEEATKVADRLRAVVAGTPVEVGEHRLSVTISVGVAAAGADTPTLPALLDRADGALYRAKEAGRNRVEVA